MVLENKLNPYSPHDSPFDLTNTVVDVHVQSEGLILMEVNDHKRTIVSRTSALLSNVSIPGHLIWRPPIYCANCLSGADVTSETAHSVATIAPDGTVEIVWGVTLESLCFGNTENFPFDDRTCYIVITHALPGNDSYIKLWPNGINTDYVWGTHEWQVNYKGTDIVPAGIQYKFELSRYSTTYVLILIVPAYVVTVICAAANILAPDVPLNERLAHTITALTALSVLTGAVLQYVPKSAALSRIGFFLLEQMFFSLLSVSAYLLSSLLETRYRLSPTIAAWLVVSFLAISNLAISAGLFCIPVSKIREAGHSNV